MIPDIVKIYLKRIPFIFELNARGKSRATKRNYRFLSSYYKQKQETISRSIECNEGDARELLKERLEARGIYVKPKSPERLRLFYVGTSYHQDYSGIIQGLQGFADVIPFQGKDGVYGQIWPTRANIKAVREENSRRLIYQVEEGLKHGPIDALLGQMWGYTIDPVALQTLRDMGLIVINIAMDDRHAFRGVKFNGEWTGTFGLIPSIDLACTTAKECCGWYVLEGCPAIYLPPASDPDIFKPSLSHKLHQVSFVGGNYGIRAKTVRAIENAGFAVSTYGSGWPDGIISTEEMAELFARSHIILGVGTIGHCTDFYSLKMRDFDAPMSASLYLTHDNPDLRELYDVGKEIETYKTLEECTQKVRHYLNHPDQADVIANAGRARAVRDHTWGKRFRKLFRAVGLLPA